MVSIGFSRLEVLFGCCSFWGLFLGIDGSLVIAKEGANVEVDEAFVTRYGN